MGFPNYKKHHIRPVIISPKTLMAYRKKVGRYPAFSQPSGLIFCYQKSLMNYIVGNHKVTKVEGFKGEMYLIGETANKVAIIGNFGAGAPIACLVLEELIAFGVKKFISIGTAGTLQKNINIGDLILCDKAIRDEGVSHHYLKPTKYSAASKSMIKRIKTALINLKQNFIVGSSWTTDAPYRETVEEVKKYQKENVLTVEMEAAALFAVAEYRKVEIGAIFTISDSLASLKWNPKYHLEKTKDSLEILYKVALKSLQK